MNYNFKGYNIYKMHFSVFIKKLLNIAFLWLIKISSKNLPFWVTKQFINLFFWKCFWNIIIKDKSKSKLIWIALFLSFVLFEAEKDLDIFYTFFSITTNEICASPCLSVFNCSNFRITVDYSNYCLSGCCGGQNTSLHWRMNFSAL